jgi:hypothetical protein
MLSFLVNQKNGGCLCLIGKIKSKPKPPERPHPDLGLYRDSAKEGLKASFDERFRSLSRAVSAH